MFMVLARVQKEIGVSLGYMTEPHVGKPYEDTLRAKIKPSISHYLVYPNAIERKKNIGKVVPLSPDSTNPIAELLYALTENFSDYMLTDWFIEDLETVSAGRDKRRRYELRQEMRARLNAIEIDNWRTKLVVNQHKVIVECI